jgi:hypothetical protein
MLTCANLLPLSPRHQRHPVTASSLPSPPPPTTPPPSPSSLPPPPFSTPPIGGPVAPKLSIFCILIFFIHLILFFLVVFTVHATTAAPIALLPPPPSLLHSTNRGPFGPHIKFSFLFKSFFIKLTNFFSVLLLHMQRRLPNGAPALLPTELGGGGGGSKGDGTARGGCREACGAGHPLGEHPTAFKRATSPLTPQHLATTTDTWQRRPTHSTHLHTYEQLLVGWIVGAALDADRPPASGGTRREALKAGRSDGTTRRGGGARQTRGKDARRGGGDARRRGKTPDDGGGGTPDDGGEDARRRGGAPDEGGARARRGGEDARRGGDARRRGAPDR